jgi:hypothetical protein
VSARTVLVIGDGDDVHVAAVVEALEKLGSRAIILDGNPRRTALGYIVEVEAPGLIIDGERFEARSFEAVWWRRKATKRQLEEPSFADREWLHALESITEPLQRARWINARAVDTTMRFKPNQLRLAARAGLDVPRTLITNDLRTVREFVAACGGSAIYKCLSWYSSGLKFLYTNRIDAADVERYSENIVEAPGIYQPVVEKAYELRVTIVGTHVFAARIDSQAREETLVDWRRNAPSLTYTATDLPWAVERALLGFHASSGLVFGAYDLIVTPAGAHVFLEVNPVGQWLWIEELTGLPIARHLAMALLGMTGR